MLVVTYASDHNHSWPSTRSSPSTSATVAASSVVASPPSPASPKLPAAVSSPSVTEDDDKFGAAVGDDALLPDEFGWFSDIAAVPRGQSILPIPICTAGAAEGGGGVVYQMGEEEESLFADLGELPECSVVFRRVEDGRRLGLAAAAPWCGSTG